MDSLRTRKAGTAIDTMSDARFDEVATLLQRAFFDDPLIGFILSDPDVRVAPLTWLMSVGLRAGQLFGEIHVTRNPLRGAAVWLPPKAGSITPEQLGQAGFDAAHQRLGEQEFTRFSLAMELTGNLQRSLMPEPHWYLVILGVSPDARRSGLGRALMEPVLARADMQGERCYLETSNPANLPFYERCGFRVLAEEPLTAGPTIWAMGRERRGEHHGDAADTEGEGR